MKKVLVFFMILFCSSLYSQNWRQKMSEPNASFFEIQEAFNEEWESKNYERGKGYKQFKRIENLLEKRVNESGLYNPGRTWKTYQQYLKQYTPNFSKSNAVCSSNSGNWSLIGPTQPASSSNGGGLGRIDCIEFHPTNANIYWVGSPSGGLWKTTNNGASWNIISNYWTNLGVSDIAVDPNNANIMYVATGDRDYGATICYGILKSTNGGSTWTQTNVGNVSTIYKILINPNNTNILLAATSQGVYRSTNSGATWTSVSSLSSGTVYDIEFSPNNPNIMYAVQYLSSTFSFLKSTNNGLSFTAQTLSSDMVSNIRRTDIGVSPANSNYVYLFSADNSYGGGFHGLYRSTNQGGSFIEIADSADIVTHPNGAAVSENTLYDNLGQQEWYDWAMAVSPNNINEIVLGGVGIVKTTNGGSNWSLIAGYNSSISQGSGGVHVDIHTLEYNPITTDLFAGCDGGIWHEPTTGGLWDNLNNGLVITQNYRLGLSNNGDKILVGNQDNNTFQYNSNTWSVATGGDGMECAYSNDAQIYYTSSQYGNVYKNGAFIFGDNITGQSSTWITTLAVHPFIQDNIYVVHEDVWFSNDAGENWTNLTNGSIGTGSLNFLEFCKNTPTTIYTGDSNELYKTTNGGASWTTVSLPSNIRIYDLVVNPNDPNEIWTVEYGEVYHSSNGGISWTDISGTLPNITFNAIAYQENSNDGIYIGGDVGIYYKDNTMSDWILFNNNLPNVIINELEINYCTGEITAATYGRGLWKSNLYCFETADMCCKPNIPTTNITNDTIVCGNLNVLLTSDTAPSGYGYQWYKDDNPLSGAVGQNYIVTSSGKYYLIFTHPSCPSFPSKPVNINSLGGNSCQTFNACQTFNPSTSSGASNTTIVNINGPFPTITTGALGVNICVTTQGDHSYSAEVFNIYDESNNLQGTTNYNNTDCDEPTQSTCFIASISSYNSWKANNIITVTLDPLTTNINPNLCSINQACVAIDVPIGANSSPNLTYNTSTTYTNLSVNGTNITINTRIENNGGTTANSSTLRYYLSTDATITTSDFQIGSDFVSSLLSNGFSSETITVDVSNLGIPNGTYYIGFIVDADGVVTESNESVSDNTKYWTSPQVTINSQPNLTYNNSNTNASVNGTLVTINTRIENNGNTTAGSSTLRYYLSTDATITTSDFQIGSDLVNSLAANGFNNETITVDVSSLGISNGTYYIGFIVDADGAVTESNESISDNTKYWTSPQVIIGNTSGCIDSTACNYDATAIINDGSCDYFSCGNDICSNAPIITCNSFINGSTTIATTNGNPTTCGTTVTASGVWYRIIGTGGNIIATTCNINTNYDTKLYVYQGSCSNLICVGGNDDSSCTSSVLHSTVSFNSNNGTSYYIFVSGYSSNTGDFELSISCGSCTPTITMNNSISSGTYEADNSVNSSGTVNYANDVTFHGGNYVQLNAGFDVPINTEFMANTVPCGTPPSAKPSAENQEEAFINITNEVETDKMQINCYLPQDSKVFLEIKDEQGNVHCSIIDGVQMKKGEYTFEYKESNTSNIEYVEFTTETTQIQKRLR